MEVGNFSSSVKRACCDLLVMCPEVGMKAVFVLGGRKARKGGE